MARVALGESRLRARRRKHRLLIGSVILGLTVILFVAGIFLSQLPFIQITQVAVSGAGAVGSPAITDFADQQLADEYLFFFPKRNFFFYPKQAIEAGLLEKFPTLKTATVHAENFHTIAVEVSERKPVALWCGEDSAAPRACFLLDEDGFAYAPAPEYSGNAFERYYGALAANRQYLSPEEFQSLFPLVEAIAKKETDETMSGVRVEQNGDVHVSFERGGEVLFGIRDTDVFQRFSLALTADPFTEHPLSDFQYLDLRFGDKIYYKLKAK